VVNKNMVRLWVALFLFPVTLSASPVSEPSDEYFAISKLIAKSGPAAAGPALRSLAEEGDAFAQLRLGRLYAGGEGIPKSDHWSYVWFARAAENGIADAEAPATAAAGRLSRTELNNAQLWANFSRAPIDETGGCLSYFPLLVPLPQSASAFGAAFRPDASAEQMVDEIVLYSGLRKNFLVRQANVPNAAAVRQGAQRLILYQPAFMEQIGQIAETAWGPYSVMAHEVGHHLQGHTLDSLGSRPDRELEADEFSGFILQMMGASLGEAQRLMQRYGQEPGTGTHPGRGARLEAIRAGYERAERLGRRNNQSANGTPVARPRPDIEIHPLPPPATAPVAEPPTQVPPPDPIPRAQTPVALPRWAAACEVAPPYPSCPMMAPVPVGAPCFCSNGWQSWPGTGR
jgi:hypothetical protein